MTMDAVQSVQFEDGDARGQGYYDGYEEKEEVDRHIKSMRGMAKENLDSYLGEYMWRSWFFPPKATIGQYLGGLVVAIIRNE
ncbi:hypothetical protein ON010_g5211 [Phytophthora cinnamomi]|nr:hypothetical protein ON010_g5211 [Phytophthora cinnamomi]